MKSRCSAIILALIFCALSTNACKKEEPKRVENPNDPFRLSGTLVSAVPESAPAFYYINYTSAAAKKLQALQDPELKKGALEKFAQLNNPFVNSLIQNGFLTGDSLEEIVLFVAPRGATAEKSVSPSVGLFFRSSEKTDLDKVLTNLRPEMEKGQLKTADLSVSGLKGFTVDLNSTATPLLPSVPGTPINEKIFVAWRKNLAMLTNDGAILSQTFEKVEGKAAGLPAIVTSPTLKEATVGFPTGEEVVSFGYGDGAALGQLIPDPKSPIPVRAVAIAAGMTTTPEMFLRVLSNIDAAPLVVNSSSKDIVGLLPANSMVNLVISGSIFNNLPDSVTAANPFAAQLSSIREIGISVRPAPLGQSMLPIPEVLIAVNSTAPDQLLSTIKQMASMGMGQGGGSNWQEKDLDGFKAQTLSAGLGLSVLAGTRGDELLASTSETLLREAVKNQNGTNFTSALPPEMRKLYAPEGRLFAGYFDFPMIGTFVESMSALSQMYAPPAPGQNGKDPVKEAAQNLKRMGRLALQATSEGKAVLVHGMYEPVVPVRK